MPRKLDPFWEFGEPKTPNDRLNLICKLLQVVWPPYVRGGVQVEVSPCTNPRI